MGTKIRDKFIEHMEFNGLAKQTQRSYINGVKGLAQYHNQSPEKLTDDQVRAYFRHLFWSVNWHGPHADHTCPALRISTDISATVKSGPFWTTTRRQGNFQLL
jgi:hypothetical protein